MSRIVVLPDRAVFTCVTKANLICLGFALPLIKPLAPEVKPKLNRDSLVQVFLNMKSVGYITKYI